jgi:hypothetical protein
MARDIYCRQDILNALRCAHVASEGATAVVAEVAGDPELLRAYRSGFERALVSVGLAFGLEPAEGTKLLRPQERAPILAD